MRNPICYVGGDTFKNIFGGTTNSRYGSVIRLKELTREQEIRWPWMKNKWAYSTSNGWCEYFKTWKECKAWILNKHPSAKFEIFWKEYARTFRGAEYVEVDE